MLKVNNKNTRTTSFDSTHCSGVFIVNFEQVSAGWVICVFSNAEFIVIFNFLKSKYKQTLGKSHEMRNDDESDEMSCECWFS